MKLYFNDLFNRIKQASILKKIFFVFIFLVEVFILFICFFKVNVEVLTPGTLHNPITPIEIENGNDRGYIAAIGIFTYKKVSLVQYWLSKANESFNVVDIDEEYYITTKEETTQGKIMKDNSLAIALINAYREASKVDESITIDEEAAYLGESVIAIYSFSDTSLEYGDIIYEINDYKFLSRNELIELMREGLKEGKNVRFKVKRGEKDVDCYANIVTTSDDKKTYAFSFDSNFSLPVTSPTYTYKANYSSIGPSGGLLATLAIYNTLLAEDITKGYKITGTGTINIDGSSGRIGGLEQKLYTANLYKVDIFFLDAADYDEYYDFYKAGNFSFELVRIEKFTDILDYLSNLEAKNGN